MRVIHYRPGTKSIGVEVQLRNSVLVLSVLFLTTVIVAPRAQAQAPARVGEAVVVQKEVLRVSTHASSQINVGDGVLRDMAASGCG